MITTLRLFSILLVYAIGYHTFRQANAKVWEKDNQTYVIYPDTELGRTLYYSWRPLAYLDGAVTGVRSHIGPHR
jgi:hypothetical protein